MTIDEPWINKQLQQAPAMTDDSRLTIANPALQRSSWRKPLSGSSTSGPISRITRRVKIVDPDGYVVEIAFDASLYGVIAYRVDRGEQVPQRSHRIEPL